MWWMLLVIIGCYAFAAMMARAAARRFAGWRSRLHVVLFAGNEEGRIEWYLRRLRRWSLRTGRDVRVTLVDCGSTDDTAAIAERFGRGAGTVTVVRSDALVDEAYGVPEDPAALKASWRSGRLTMTAADTAYGKSGINGLGGRAGGGAGMGSRAGGGQGDDNGGEGDGRFAEEWLLIDLGDPADVAMLP